MPRNRAEGKKALGKVLVEKGYITAENLEKLIHDQIEEIIFDLFVWDKGDFEYKDARLNLQGMVITRLNVVKLLLEASRRIDEMSIFIKNALILLTNNFKKLLNFSISSATCLLPNCYQNF